MKRLPLIVLLVALPALVACRSRVIQVTLINTSAQPVSTIIVDYPGATFGVNSLAPGKTFLYSIKPLENGPLKLQYTDMRGGIHRYLGLSLHKNQEGTIDVKLTQESATVVPALR
jgi:hypothetical protein